MPLTDRDRRTLIIGGCTLAGIVALFLIYTLLTSGSGSEVALPPFSPPASTATGGPSSGPTGSQTGTPSVQPTVPPVQNFSGRDPFSVPPILQTTSPTTSSGGTTSTSTSTSTTPPSTSSPPTTPGGGSSTVIGGHTVVLLDVFPKDGKTRVQVEVDGTVYNVAEGGTFASGQFEFRSASGNCATFLFGDQSFSLCATSSK